MTNGVGTLYSALKRCLVEDVACPQLTQTRLGRTRESEYGMPCHGELPDDSAADESSGPGNQNAHASVSLPV
jgi:hypothetical protein